MFESKEDKNKLVSRHKQHAGPFNFHPPFAFHQNISTRKSEDTLKIVFRKHSSSFFFKGILSRNSTVMSMKTSLNNISFAIITLWRLLLFINLYQYERGSLEVDWEQIWRRDNSLLQCDVYKIQVRILYNRELF